MSTSSFLRPIRRLGGAQTRALVLLVAVTLTWGSTFPLLKDTLGRLPAADLLAVRFGVAALALVALRTSVLAGLTRPVVGRGVVLGLLYGVAQVLQTVGLEHTSATVSGFLTSAYVVLTPVLGALVLRRAVPRAAWAAVAVSTVGIGVLSLRGLAVGPGEALTLLSAVFYALHILGLGAWATTKDAYASSVVQLVVVTVVTGAAAAPGGLTLPTRTADLVAVLYLGVVAGAGALLVQTWAQAHVAPERAAVVMTLEPVWAAGFSVLLLGEALGGRVLLGGLMILGAMLVSERPDLLTAVLDATRDPVLDGADRVRLLLDRAAGVTALALQPLPDVVGPRGVVTALRAHEPRARRTVPPQPCAAGA